MNNLFFSAEFIVNLKLLMMILLLFYFLFLYEFNKRSKLPIFEYSLLILICFLSLQLIITSNHLFIIFLFMELVNLCIYCLLGLNNNLNRGIESSFKYFIQSAYATIIGIFGLSLIYMSNGTLLISELHVLLNSDLNSINNNALAGLLAVILSIFFKIGMFPVHI